MIWISSSTYNYLIKIKNIKYDMRWNILGVVISGGGVVGSGWSIKSYEIIFFKVFAKNLRMLETLI